MRATILYPQGDPQGEEENSQECGRAEKKARGLGGGLVSNNVYKVVVRKEAAGRGK